MKEVNDQNGSLDVLPDAIVECGRLQRERQYALCAGC